MMPAGGAVRCGVRLSFFFARVTMPIQDAFPGSSEAPAHAPAGILDGLARQGAGTVGPGALARDSVLRAQASQAVLKAFTCINPSSPDPDAAGPLAGIPIGVKDLMATADMVTASGSPIFADHVPAADAWVVARLRSLGAFVTGKTVTTEFAWRHPGPTCNPWNPGHTPGGSSSGSAAAVAAGIVSAALGTQTLGSVIRPAAFCGVVGMKPSRGAISRTGVQPLSGSMDHVGVFARTVSDAGYLLSWLIGTDHADRHGEPLPGFTVAPEIGVVALERPRFALMHTAVFDRASQAQKIVLESVVEALRAAGAVVESLELPPAFDAVWTDTMTLIDAEAAVIHGVHCDRHPDLVSGHVHGLVERGRQVRAETYLQAHARQQALRATFTDVIGDYDCVLTLPAAGEAPAGLEDTGDGSFCAPWSFLGVPAITMPAALSANGLPLGVQLVGAYRNDLHLLRAARWCETVLGFTAVCPRRY
jgi:Asp-tRNA(Asn)/Glu-tRNA(Gln) amidotransferase A subunit family amidase